MKREKAKKKRSVVGIIFTVIGILLGLVLVAILGTVGYFYFSMKNAEVPKDRAEEMREVNNISFDERYAYRGGTVDVFLDENDLYYFLNFETDELAREFNSVFSMAELEAYHLEIKDDGPWMSAAVQLGKLRLAASLRFCLSYDNGKVMVTPDQIKIAALKLNITNVAEKLKLDISDFAWEVRVRPQVMADIESFNYEEGKVIVSGAFDTSVLESFSVGSNFEMDLDNDVSLFSPEYREVLGAANIYTTEGTAAGTDALKAYLDQNGVQTFFQEYLTAVSSTAKNNFFNENHLITDRFFAGEDYLPDHVALIDKINAYEDDLYTLVDRLNTAYNAGDLTIREGRWFLGEEEVSLADFFDELLIDEKEMLIDPDLCEISLVALTSSFLKESPEVLERIDSLDSLQDTVDEGEIYGVAIAIPAYDGRNVLVMQGLTPPNSDLHHQYDIYFLSTRQFTPGQDGVPVIKQHLAG